MAKCEGLCSVTEGCRWYSYCPDHLDPALPTWAPYTECSNAAYSGASGEEPLSQFGVKRNKCVLYNECYRSGVPCPPFSSERNASHTPGIFNRVGLNLGGKINYLGFFTFMHSERSVIAGEDAIFPPELPEPLKRKHNAPDSQHPSLKFWFAPETLEQQGYRTGDKVMMWWNVANICVQGHPDQYLSGENVTNDKDLKKDGGCNPDRSNLFVRGQRPQKYGTAQDFLMTAGNVQKELFLQVTYAISLTFASLMQSA